MHSIRALKYGMPILLTLAIMVGMQQGGWWSFLGLGIGFVLIPLLEILIPIDTANIEKAEEEVAKQSRLYDWMLYLILPLQLTVLALTLYWVSPYSPRALTTLEIVGNTLALGLLCGIFGINVAHELGHRKKGYERAMAKALLWTTNYMHFYIEHNRGHHKNVSTPKDPASARRGESVYQFYFRSMVFSWLSAWHLERTRLAKAGKSFWNPLHNEMLRFQLIQAATFAAVFGFLGVTAGLVFLGASLMGALLLETVNYIEHYGLQRKELKPGVYERTLPVHSWNSSHVVGRLFLFELTRHSDHHFLANRPYQILRHHDDAPQMPAGYPAMMLLSLVPPLWFWVMHRQIDHLRTDNVHGAALA